MSNSFELAPHNKLCFSSARGGLTLEQHWDAPLRVKHVVGVKLADEAAAKKRADNKIEKEMLLKSLADKQAGKLSELSEVELLRRIAALEE